MKNMRFQRYAIVGQHILGLKKWFTPLKNNIIMVSLDVIIMFRSSIFSVKRLIFMITNGANEKMRFQRYVIVGQHIFGPKTWFIPLKMYVHLLSNGQA